MRLMPDSWKLPGDTDQRNRGKGGGFEFYFAEKREFIETKVSHKPSAHPIVEPLGLARSPLIYHTKKEYGEPALCPCKEGKMKCKKCGETLLRLMILALAQDAGARVYPSATECLAGEEHEFVEEKVTK